jgi:hypothetical protein
MKRIFTFIALFAIAVSAMATDYTDQLTVNVNGSITSQTATISVTQQNGKYTLSLNNFILLIGAEKMGIGNIVLSDLTGQDINGYTVLKTKQNITITAGNDSSISVWMGPQLGLVPVDMIAKIKGDKLYTVININMQSMNQIIQVTFGTGYQIPNSDFENFHTVSSSSVEPNNWHSFKSASGSLASMAGDHLFKSTDVRTGATGTSCALLKSTSIFTIIANGTMTTGRINAGSISPDNTANNAFLDMSKTDKDANGDPFYSTLSDNPDSLAVWVKFTQGTPNANHPYATVSAAITDGTYYQDPEDKTYTNVVAKGKDNTIASNGSVWQRIAFPFNYTSNSVDTKAILVTISTNADAGKGSVDELYVDDISLIYNAKLTSLKIKGNDVPGFSSDVTTYDLSMEGKPSAADITTATEGKGAFTITEITETTTGETVLVTVASADLKTTKNYTLNITDTTQGGISNISTDNVQPVAVYNINGQRIEHMQQHGFYIVKQADGKTVKVLK